MDSGSGDRAYSPMRIVPPLDVAEDDEEDWLAGALEPIRLIVVEGKALYGCALQAVLSAEPDMEVVGLLCPDDLEATLPHAQVAVVDLDMPHDDRTAACRTLERVAPDCRRIALSSRPLPRPLPAELRTGTYGLVSKHSSTRVLVEAVREVNAGGQVLDPRLGPALRSTTIEALTRRELELLTRAADGSSTAELAAQLLLSEGTVRNYLHRAGAKLGARNRLEAISMVRAAGWL
jgi:two-component system response regulator DesR